MKTFRAIATLALVAILAGCVYEPGHVRHSHRAYYGDDVYVSPYGSGYRYGPRVGIGIHYDDRHRDKRHRWRDRHGHWHD